MLETTITPNRNATKPNEGLMKILSAQAQPTGGQKADDGKLPMHLLDPQWLEGIAKVLQFGAEKYQPDNWRKGIEHTRLYSAAQRHLNQYAQGWVVDTESGQSHLLHASCCLMFLYFMTQHREDLNDFYWKDEYQDGQGRTLYGTDLES